MAKVEADRQEEEVHKLEAERERLKAELAAVKDQLDEQDGAVKGQWDEEDDEYENTCDGAHRDHMEDCIRSKQAEIEQAQKDISYYEGEVRLMNRRIELRKINAVKRRYGDPDIRAIPSTTSELSDSEAESEDEEEGEEEEE